MWPHGCSGRRRPRPPARLGGLTSFGAAPRSPPVPSGPSGALHTSGAYCAHMLPCPRHRPRAPQPAPPHLRALARQAPTGTPSLTPRPSLPSFLNPHAISHAIPPRLFQTFNLDRWNCNVFRLCWNFSQSNCMRLFGGRLRTPPRAPQPGTSHMTRPHEREKIRPARLHQRPHAKKFAQHRQNCLKSALFRLQGELFRGLFQNPLLLGEYFRADGCHSHLTAPADHLA